MTAFVPAYTKQGRQIASQTRRVRPATGGFVTPRRSDQDRWNKAVEARRQNRLEKRLLKEHYSDL